MSAEIRVRQEETESGREDSIAARVLMAASNVSRVRNELLEEHNHLTGVQRMSEVFRMRLHRMANSIIAAISLHRKVRDGQRSRRSSAWMLH